MRRYLPHILVIALVVSLGAALGTSSCGEEAGPSASTHAGSGDASPTHGLTAEQAAEVAATVGDTEITVGEVADQLARNSAFVRTRYNSPERRREFLDQLIRFELLAQEAERRGYYDLPEVQRARKQQMIRRYLEEQQFEQGGPESIPAEDVRAYYEAHRSEYHTPQQVRASHILFADRATAETVLSELRGHEDDLRLYRQLAERHNTDPSTRDRYGDLRFFARPGEATPTDPEVPSAVREAAFAIEQIGGIHPTVVESPLGFHIVKLTGRRAASHRSLESADRLIRNRLWRERREAAIQARIELLRAEADVEQNLELLDQLHLDLPEEGSSAIDPPALSPDRAPLVPPGAEP